ncbi:MAG: hypothetical protein ACPGOY_04390 [Rhodospirillaceae bacterium]
MMNDIYFDEKVESSDYEINTGFTLSDNYGSNTAVETHKQKATFKTHTYRFYSDESRSDRIIHCYCVFIDGPDIPVNCPGIGSEYRKFFVVDILRPDLSSGLLRPYVDNIIEKIEKILKNKKHKHISQKLDDVVFYTAHQGNKTVEKYQEKFRVLRKTNPHEFEEIILGFVGECIDG